jgi:hypothetical protein
LAPASANSRLQGSDPLLKSSEAPQELPQLAAIKARCGGSGRGPSSGRAFSVGAPCGRRGAGGGVIARACAALGGSGPGSRRPQARQRVRQRRVGGERRELILPQVDELFGQSVEVVGR